MQGKVKPHFLIRVESSLQPSSVLASRVTQLESQLDEVKTDAIPDVMKMLLCTILQGVG